LEINIKVKQYYKTEEEFKDIHARLKLTLCPHCNARGFLILHGYLYGYSETGMERIRRGHRIFCSNRKMKKGCGRTFSILISVLIKNFILSTETLWCFLDKVKDGMSLAESFRASGSDMSDGAIYRILRKFRHNQVYIRTLLTGRRAPPDIKHVKDPVIQTIIHLKTAFNGSLCPVSQFQYHFQTSFL
jgi:hypothetical protein